MQTLNREDDLYWAVEAGLLLIDPDGKIWRVGFRRSDGWGNAAQIKRCPPRRAEHLSGEYFQVRLMRDTRRIHALAHRLVWRHIVGPIPDGLTVNHKNGVKTDNRPENLELATPTTQQVHARRVLRRGRLDQYGMRNAMVKLTAEQVEEIRARRADGELLESIAKDYGVRMQHISKIARGDRRSRG